jgi:hypothetical protein
MEVGEAVSPPGVDTDETKCPFDHARLSPPEVKNDLVGVGGTLARKMKSQDGTHTYEYSEGIKKKVDEKILNPRDQVDHPFYKKAAIIAIPMGTETKFYPVSCAAHHCIPAQESLKESPLLAFMCKKGSSEQLKDATFADGQVWSAIGYDVNGSQNGVFLPGSYAVGGGRGGMKIWGPTGENDDDEDPGEPPPPSNDSNQLTGALYEISESNRKWLYVKQAIDKRPGQFHDRHVDYSQFVQSILQKVYENYANLHESMILDEKCGDCKKKADAIKKDGIPTPFGLVNRLNQVSKKLAGWLAGRSWRMNVFTSKWCLAYMKSMKSKKSKS